MSYAVDRDVVAQVAGNGYSSPISTAFPPSVGYDSEDVNGQVYDLDKAKECLEAAGYSDSDGMELWIRMERICPLQFLLPMVLQQQ
ncbi:MAG: ABC transporter substrate-binding protein [Ruminococcus sp.]